MALFRDIQLSLTFDIRDSERIISIFNDYLKQLALYLGLKPNYTYKRIRIKTNTDVLVQANFFNYGIQKSQINEVLIFNLKKNELKFLSFIFVREMLRCFIPYELRNNDSINIIINQIIMELLYENDLINEWRSFVRNNLEQDKNFKLVNDFDRLEQFFYYQKFVAAPNPVQFFFNYINTKITLKESSDQSFTYIIFKDFEERIAKLMIAEDLAETIRLISKIFYHTKLYRNILQYKNLFQEYKKEGLINTGLSLRKFSEKMEWIKLHSFISPSYHINWNAINMGLLVINIYFNPKINDKQINFLIQKFPFIVSPKESLQSKTKNIIAYIVFPINYLEDLIEYFKILYKNQYISKFFILRRISQEHCINLNYYREEFSNSSVMNTNHSKYDKKFEICFDLPPESNFFKPNLSILDFLILDRIRWFSITGLGFENRTENLKLLKSDLLNEINDRRSLIDNLKRIITEIYHSDIIKRKLVSFIAKYLDLGFFNLKHFLEKSLEVIKIFTDIIENQKITDLEMLNNYLSSEFYSNLIEYNLIINWFKKSDNFDIIITYFNSKPTFKEIIEIYSLCNELLNIFYDLKIFNLDLIRDIILDENLIQNLFLAKRKKLEELYENYKLQEITSILIDETIKRFIESTPSIIYPLLINTVYTKHFEKDYLQIFLNASKKVKAKLSLIKSIFPRILIYLTEDILSNRKYFYIEISIPELNSEEISRFFSIIYNLFRNDLIYMKNHLWSGIITGFSSRNFYDYEKNEFFYNSDLFDQFYRFTNTFLKGNYSKISTKKLERCDLLWRKEEKLDDLVGMINYRKLTENIIFDTILLKKLDSFNSRLNTFIIDTENFIKIKKEFFFKNYVKSISFIPLFANFGLNQYVEYFLSNDLNNLELKSFFNNKILAVEHPACIDYSIPFLVRSIINKKFDNKVINSLRDHLLEYFGFIIKNIMPLLHFNLNITPEGWDYDSSIFKEHLENVLFNKDYDFKNLNENLFRYKKIITNTKYGLDSPEYGNLCEIFDYNSIDIKSYIGTKKVKTVGRIQSLLKKGLIFPFIKLKNLGFQESIYFIIPNLNQESMDALIKIFSWFNYGFIYEIEGTYFIQGFEEPIDFKLGLMMEIYFPKCELAEFKQLFDLVFEYLEIDYYLILKDFVNGDTLVKNVYEDPNFFDNYHPLRNVK